MLNEDSKQLLDRRMVEMRYYYSYVRLKEGSKSKIFGQSLDSNESVGQSEGGQ